MILHPGEVHARSPRPERVGLPDDIVGRLDGKSSLGRLGLVIHSTAGFIGRRVDGNHPRVVHVANLPITLYPGMKLGENQFL